MGIFVDSHENNCTVVVFNGVHHVTIRLMGMDRPDSARGMKLRYAVLDEYADFPEDVWQEVIRPALMDCRGGALFIGTPKGKNHFYRMYCEALGGELGPEWEAFSFQSKDNHTLNEDELEQMAQDYAKGSPELFAQEIEGKFITKGGALFDGDDFIIDSDEPQHGTWHVTCDLAGFGKTSHKTSAQIKKLDESAIAIVKHYQCKDNNGKTTTGWWVKEIQHGRWDVEETARRIVDACESVGASSCGIEKGISKNAVEHELARYQQKRGVWLNLIDLTHGNQKKYDRIQWAMQGRAKTGVIALNKGPWNEVLLEQAIDFPSKLTHDDLLDALAYQDQTAGHIAFDLSAMQDEWEAGDPISGY